MTIHSQLFCKDKMTREVFFKPSFFSATEHIAYTNEFRAVQCSTLQCVLQKQDISKHVQGPGEKVGSVNTNDIPASFHSLGGTSAKILGNT